MTFWKSLTDRLKAMVGRSTFVGIGAPTTPLGCGKLVGKVRCTKGVKYRAHHPKREKCRPPSALLYMNKIDS